MVRYYTSLLLATTNANQIGLYVYTMNYCTIVQTTDCAVSLTTGGPVPETPATPVPTGDESSSGLGSVTTSVTTGISVPATETAGDGDPTHTHDHEAPPTHSTTGGAAVVDTAQAALLGVAGIAMAFF
jgi:hypothetical protein